MENRSDADVCVACGRTVGEHFDSRNRKMSCEQLALQLTPPVREGRLFTLRLKRSTECRAEAMATVKPCVHTTCKGKIWVGRIGGKQRGWWVHGTKRQVESAIDSHYNEELLKFVTRQRKP